MSRRGVSRYCDSCVLTPLQNQRPEKEEKGDSESSACMHPKKHKCDQIVRGPETSITENFLAFCFAMSSVNLSSEFLFMLISLLRLVGERSSSLLHLRRKEGEERLELLSSFRGAFSFAKISQYTVCGTFQSLFFSSKLPHIIRPINKLIQ